MSTIRFIIKLLQPRKATIIFHQHVRLIMSISRFHHVSSDDIQITSTLIPTVHSMVRDHLSAADQNAGAFNNG